MKPPTAVPQRVIVTRPDREARAWVQTLAEHGLDAVALPLIDICPVPDSGKVGLIRAQAAAYDAVMFVSGSAVEHFFALRPPDAVAFGTPAATRPRAWGTGPGTAAALLRCGVDNQLIDVPDAGSGQFDSEALWAAVAPRVRPGDRVLIVRGEDTDRGQASPGNTGEAPAGFGRDWLARRLVQAGVLVEFVAVYERRVPQLQPHQIALAQAAARDGSVWLFTSAQAVAHLGCCLPRQEWAGARALATHARIAAAVRAAGFGVVWESRPSIPDVVASIESTA